MLVLDGIHQRTHMSVVSQGKRFNLSNLELEYETGSSRRFTRQLNEMLLILKSSRWGQKKDLLFRALANEIDHFFKLSISLHYLWYV